MTSFDSNALDNRFYSGFVNIICSKHLSRFILILLKKNLIATFYGLGSSVSRLQSHYEETVYFLPLKSPGVMSTRLIDLGNAESALESPSGFEPVLMRSFKKIFFPNCD